MINIQRMLKNFGQLELLVLSSIIYVIAMLVWTASTRSAVMEKANTIKQNHKNVIDFLNNEVNKCSADMELNTAWGDKCKDSWSSPAN